MYVFKIYVYPDKHIAYIYRPLQSNVYGFMTLVKHNKTENVVNLYAIFQSNF
jgi:hypothetical protein